MGATFVAYACALMAYLYLVFTDPAYNSNGEFTPVVVAYAFLIGLQITNCFTTPLGSGIDTLFVGMAWYVQLREQTVHERSLICRCSQGSSGCVMPTRCALSNSRSSDAVAGGAFANM